MNLNRRQFARMLGAGAALPWLAGPGMRQGSRAPLEPPDSSFFDKVLPGLLEVTGVPGFAAGVLQGGRLTFEKYHGLAEAGTSRPISSDTMFPAASLSKPVMAYATLGLVAESKLDLDRPLKAYVPDHAPADPRGDRVTARHVLSHSSGFRNWRNSVEQSLVPDFEPGHRFQYSGEGFYYLQRVIETVSGLGFERFMQDRLLGPLGMRATTYAWREDVEGRLVSGHQRGTASRPPSRDFASRLLAFAAAAGKPLSSFTHEDTVAAMREIKPSPPALPNFMIPNAAASMLTTVRDYSAYLVALLEPRGAAVRLPPELRREMFAPQTRINAALNWGLGWGLEHAGGREYLWHWGDNGTFKNFVVAHLPSRSAAVIFTNSTHGMRVAEAFVEAATGHQHPAFDWL